MPAKQLSLGIMTRCQGSRFADKGFYRKLTEYGRKRGFRVFVFSPRTVDFAARTVRGFEYRNGIWASGTFPLPDLVYDRCFVGPSYRHYKPFVEKLQKDPKITFLGHGLSGKWQVHQMLIQSPKLAPFLPPTELLSKSSLQQVLKTFGAAVIKPMAGTHGIGVARIRPAGGGYEILGRNRENKPFRRRVKGQAGLNLFLRSFTSGRKFLVQPYLHLHTADGVPYDVRVLVQKNGMGQWETTGMAVRLGNRHSITSNLHGGGRAVPLSPFLSRHFPPSLQNRIEQQIHTLVSELPLFLEESHGRLVELGIDVGIDLDGKVWLIEVNSRPGRTVFRMIDDHQARLRSITQPIRYADYLMKTRVGGY